MKTEFQPGSIAGRMAAFFEQNPYEELTTADAAIKFDATAKSIRGARDRLTRKGLIETVQVMRRPSDEL